MRELRQHQRESPTIAFHLCLAARFATISARIVERAGVVADLGIKVHAHMLRNSTGYNDALIDAAVELWPTLELPPHEPSRQPWRLLDYLDELFGPHAVPSVAGPQRGPARCRTARNCSYFSGWRDQRRCGFVIDLWVFPRATVQ